MSNISKYANTKGSKPIVGNISDSALSRATGIPVDTLRTWKKTGPNNWRNNHYYFLKTFTKQEIEEKLLRAKALKN